jgi:type IV secretion system protein VirB6
MATPNFSNIIVELSNKIDGITRTFSHDGYHAMAQALAKPIGVLCVLFITLTGYSILRGLIKTPMREFVNVVIRIGVVYTFALNWGEFSAYFEGLFVKGASDLGSVMMGATHAGAPGTGINQALQSVFTEITSVGMWAMKKASVRNLSPLGTGIAIYVSGIAVVGLAFFEILLAKMMLAICMAAAPLFLSFTLFEKTRPFFDKWLGTLVGFSLVLVMVSTVVGICLSLVHWVVAPLYINEAAEITAGDWLPLALVSIVSVMLILEITNVAKGIGGACASSGSGSAMMGGFMGAALGMTKNATRMTGMNKALRLVAGGTKQAAGNGMKRAGMALQRGIQKRLRGG